ncbi:MAG: hypothetical protein WC722_13365 [Rhodospirillales bacterium]|jgi:hypothetical protein
MQISRNIKDERLGQFLREAEEGVLRSLLDQIEEDKAIAAALDDIRARGEDAPALSAADFLAAMRKDKLV